MTLPTDVSARNQSQYYSTEQLLSIKQAKIPQHIAVIPDGNRRWAKSHALLRDKGHQQGADGLLDIVEAARDLGVKLLTFYTFSTENWSRGEDEVAALMGLLETYLTEQRARMIREGVRLSSVGELSKMPPRVLRALHGTKEATADQEQIEVILAINYGARDEMRRAVHAMVDDALAKQISPSEIDEEMISRYLDTRHWPDPDLLIRAGGGAPAEQLLIVANIL